jgi:DNA-binding transcriptional regulator YdaS (Cro superfamily)
MDLKAYFSPLSPEQKQELADKCGTSVGHLRNVANGKTCGPALATALERATDSQVTRKDMRPADCWLIWPDIKPPKRVREAA